MCWRESIPSFLKWHYQSIFYKSILSCRWWITFIILVYIYCSSKVKGAKFGPIFGWGLVKLGQAILDKSWSSIVYLLLNDIVLIKLLVKRVFLKTDDIIISYI